MFSIVGLVIERHSYVIYPEFICFVTLPTIWLSRFRISNVLFRLLIVLAESDIANRRYTLHVRASNQRGLGG